MEQNELETNAILIIRLISELHQTVSNFSHNKITNCLNNTTRCTDNLDERLCMHDDACITQSSK